MALVLDGGMGTMLQRGFTEEQVLRMYVEAGADIITTNTFTANRISQAATGLADKAAQMAFEGARTARKVADAAPRKVLVAGSVGPTGKSLTMASDADDPGFREYSFDEMAAAFEEQVSALLRGGADIILLETCFDALNAKALIYALEKLGNPCPLYISATVSDRSGRTLTGQTLEAFYRSVSHAKTLAAFGINCALGAAAMAPLVREIASFSSHPVIFYPNAGVPDEFGNYNDTPEEMAEVIGGLVRDGYVQIAGGCCGTTPEHIRAIAQVVYSCGLGASSPCGLGASATGSACSAKARENATQAELSHQQSAARKNATQSGQSDSQSAARKNATQAELSRRQSGDSLYVSGLESVEISRARNFMNVGERTNVAGSKKFARLVAEDNWEEALRIAEAQIEGGADVIDINMDDPMVDSKEKMRTFLRHIAGEPAIAKAALMIDSSHWETVLEGLKNAQGKCIVNSISLKDGRGEFLRKALEIRRLGGAMVVMAFDEEGQAVSFDRKVAICKRSYDLLTAAGVPSTDIIFDCNILSIGTGIAEHARFGVDFIEAVRWIKANLPGVKTSGGVSNLSFAFRGNNVVREAMHSAFLYHAIRAGLDMAIVNPQMIQIYDEIEPELRKRVEDVIFDSDAEATSRLVEYASNPYGLGENPTGPLCSAKARENATQSGQSDSQSAAGENAPFSVALGADATGSTCSAKARENATQAELSRRQSGESGLDPIERLTGAVVKGVSAGIEESAMGAYGVLKSAVEVIEGPLMKGMEKVGELFAAGRMFLPQVVKSAKVMREAVAVLQPYMGDASEGSGRPVFVIATVQGDVHDIGKNITAIVLQCSGFEVVDLGVMVPCADILDKAVEVGAVAVGVSGLITPSLSRMEEICSEMSARGMDIPLFVGGAAASAVHTAVRLSPLYPNVHYGADASATAVMAKKYLIDKESFIADELKEREKLIALRSSAVAKPVKPVVTDGFPTTSFKDIPFCEMPAETFIEHFDWRMFFAVCGVKCEHCEGAGLRREAQTFLETAGLKVRLALRFFDAHREDDDIVTPVFRLPMLRDGVCLADYFPASGSSQLGLFAATVVQPTPSDDLVAHAVRVTLAEAASEWIGAQLDTKHIRPGIGYACCPDHSLKRDVLALLPSELGITLTESCAMIPEASVCGLVIAHPLASYNDIRHVSDADLDAYAARRGMSESEKMLFLGHLVILKK
ncbi:MAG: homocysteine S-methyltransferase family protein [Bacteroidales bacterium]|nr:homocysteine S-methyltransferase family protein [Bacteroidales bacterium]